MPERELDTAYGEELVWSPEVPRFNPFKLAINWIVSAVAVGVAAAIVPHVAVKGVGEAFIAAAVIAILNALLSPVIAALRLPFTLAIGFVLVLVLDAVVLLLASKIDPNSIKVDSFGWALAAAMIEPRLAIPVHWGTFALPWARGGDTDRPAREFAELAAELAPEVEVRVLQPGETAEL